MPSSAPSAGGARQRAGAKAKSGSSAPSKGAVPVAESGDDNGSQGSFFLRLAGPSLLFFVVGMAARWLVQFSPLKSSSSAWVAAGTTVRNTVMTNVTCAPRRSKGACGRPRNNDACARFVLDDAVPEKEAAELRKMIEWLIEEAWGAGSGPPSVVDLHQGSISYKDSFVELAQLMEFKSITFSEAQKEAYYAVRRYLRTRLSGLFGIPEEALLHDLTFFSHINGSKEAVTMHDEYWHQHIDTEQYGTFEYTALLYLSTSGSDFNGGEFVFDNATRLSKANVEAVVEPRYNRLVAFTSDAENPHHVKKVSDGIRITLTAAFTCDEEKAAAVGPAFPPKRPEEGEE